MERQIFLLIQIKGNLLKKSHDLHERRRLKTQQSKCVLIYFTHTHTHTETVGCSSRCQRRELATATAPHSFLQFRIAHPARQNPSVTRLCSEITQPSGTSREASPLFSSITSSLVILNHSVVPPSNEPSLSYTSSESRDPSPAVCVLMGNLRCLCCAVHSAGKQRANLNHSQGVQVTTEDIRVEVSVPEVLFSISKPFEKGSLGLYGEAQAFQVWSFSNSDLILQH